MTLTVGSLFSGIGGLDLGLERAGMTVIWQSEYDPYASRVLANHWPDVPNLGDITTIDWTTVEPPDLICGGYPCQPFSLAGVRQGETDPRHLWPHFADAIRHLRPRWALLENVPGHLSLGFGRVLGDLAELGYDTEWDCIPAAAVGAPHLRYRIFVVGHDGEDRDVADPGILRLDRWPGVEGVGRDEAVGREAVDHAGNGGDASSDMADTDGERLEGAESVGIRHRQLAQHSNAGRPTASWWAVEPAVGRVADGVPRRVDRLRTLGNAVVPQVAELIGRAIIAEAAP